MSPPGRFQSSCTARRFCLLQQHTNTNEKKKLSRNSKRNENENSNENTFHWKLAGRMAGNSVLKCEKPSCFSRLGILTRNESPVCFCPFQKLLQYNFKPIEIPYSFLLSFDQTSCLPLYSFSFFFPPSVRCSEIHQGDVGLL